MHRFLYITDTHWGVQAGQGWGQQPRDPAKFDAINDGLREWLKINPVDFVLHGGDATEDGTPEQIDFAVGALSSLGPPVYLCLGNHDLSQPDSIATWRANATANLPEGQTSYVVRGPMYDVIVIAHHWNYTSPPHYWDKSGQTPLLDEAQVDLITSHLATTSRPAILALHAPVMGIPTSQTGLAEPLHEPDEAWRALVLGLLRRYSSLRLVLTAHNHAHTLHHIGEQVVMSTASLVETPFEGRLITVGNDSIDVQTLCFAELLGLRGEYDSARAWVHGKAAQRHCHIQI